MTCTFSAEQITALSAPLHRAKVLQREQGRSQVSYLESVQGTHWDLVWFRSPTIPWLPAHSMT